MPERVHHPIFARLCDRMAARADQGEEREIREEMLAGLRGRVLEVGAGNGVNFALYPAGVSEVVAVEPEDYLRRRAQEAAERAHVPVRVVDGVAGELPVEDASFDAVVACQVLCSVASQHAALAEIRRVLAAGAELRFYEHVIARDPRHARWQRLAVRVTPTLCGGCHCDRDTGAAIESAGFEVERCRRFIYQPSAPEYFGAPKILGVARLP